MSIRSAIALAAVALSLLAFGSTAGLILLLAQTARTSAALQTHDRSVVAAERIVAALLLANRERFLDQVIPGEGHDQQADRHEEVLLETLRGAALDVQGQEERLVLLRLQESVERFLDELHTVRSPPLEEYRAASALLDVSLIHADTYVQLNREQARQAIQQAARWQRLALVGGISITLALLLLVLLVTVGARRGIYRPFLNLETAIARYAAGDRSARVPSGGPAEIRAIADQFDAMADALEAQRRAQLTFLSAVAHDLRNPLAALKTAAQLAERDVAAAPERLAGRIALVRQQVDRLHHMVGDLLDVTRVEAGELQMERGEHDLRAAVEEAAALFEHSSERHTLHVEMPREPVLADYDPLRIGQVLNNLLSNAFKYTPEGGPIDLRLSTSHGYAILEVQDRGLGIGREEIEQLFEPFRRGKAVAGSIPGVGLGLSASRKLVEGHGGSIDVESEPGVGSTFRVRLPLR